MVSASCASEGSFMHDPHQLLHPQAGLSSPRVVTRAGTPERGRDKNRWTALLNLNLGGLLIEQKMRGKGSRDTRKTWPSYARGCWLPPSIHHPSAGKHLITGSLGRFGWWGGCGVPRFVVSANFHDVSTPPKAGFKSCQWIQNWGEIACSWLSWASVSQL